MLKFASKTTIVYPCYGARSPSSSLKTLGQSKSFMGAPLERETKVNINSQGYMTKVAAMPIYGKNL